MKKTLLILSALLTYHSTTLASTTDQLICENGSIIKAAYPATDTAIIEVNGELHLLKSAIAASGVRYTGEGIQWWTKGGEATLTKLKPKEQYASNTGLNCRTIKYEVPSLK